ncbi:MAG: hypothetical protein ACFNZS_00035 [Ottowia sp.]
MQCFDQVWVQYKETDKETGEKKRGPHHGRVGFVIGVENQNTENEKVKVRLDANSYFGFSEVDYVFNVGDLVKL